MRGSQTLSKRLTYLNQVKSGKVPFLHIDMNCAKPEIEALNYFWDKLVVGAHVLLDDYAYKGYETQYRAMNAYVGKKGIKL